MYCKSNFFKVSFLAILKLLVENYVITIIVNVIF